jgi:hypothetical protein
MSKHKYSKEFIERTGLNLEDINPAKVEAAETPKVKEKVEPKFTEKAIGMFRVKQVDAGGFDYSIVEITYDPVTGLAGEVKSVFKESSKEEAVNQFKLKVDELNLFYYDR